MDLANFLGWLGWGRLKGNSCKHAGSAVPRVDQVPGTGPGRGTPIGREQRDGKWGRTRHGDSMYAVKGPALESKRGVKGKRGSGCGS
jgi:predicted oxidoreductase